MTRAADSFFRTYLFELAEIFILTQLIEIGSCFRVVETVVVVYLAISCQLTELNVTAFTRANKIAV